MPHSPQELRAMDEQDARETLTVDEYERWEQIQELYDEVEETEEAIETEAEAVADITVRADPEALGTRVDVFGNSLLVNVDPEDPTVRDIAESLESDFDDETDIEDFDGETADELAQRLCDLLDVALVKWEGTVWDDLPEAERQRVLEDARAKWGLTGLVDAWGEISAAVQEDREAKVSRVEQFRNPERRGDR